MILPIVLLLLILLPTPALSQPARNQFAPWNTYLNHQIIAECHNTADSDFRGRLEFEDYAGLMRRTYPVTLGPNRSISLNLTAVQSPTPTNPPLPTDSYGTAILSGTEGDTAAVYCHLPHYRFRNDHSDRSIEYGFDMSFLAPMSGPHFGTFNSIDPDGSTSTVLNWLSIINTAATDSTFTLTLYRSTGAVQSTISIRPLSPGERYDIPLGHPDGQSIGAYRITATDASKPFISFLMRYGSESESFRFAFPLLFQTGPLEEFQLPVSTMGSAYNWGELLNTSDNPITASVEVVDQNGTQLLSAHFLLQAHAQQHIDLHSLIGPFNVGVMRVRSSALNGAPIRALLGTSIYYGRPQGKVTWAYVSQPTSVAAENSDFVASVNTSYGAPNWTKLLNTTDLALSLTLAAHSNAAGSLWQLTSEIPTGGSRDIGWHERFPVNDLGFVRIVAEQQNPRAVDHVRVFPDAQGQIGYIMRVPPALISTQEPNSSSSQSSSSSSSGSTECNDGLDNDNDGRIDLTDLGCGSSDDESERGPCDFYSLYDAVEGPYSDNAGLGRYGVIEGKAVFLYEGQYGHFPRRFCYRGVCTDDHGVIPQAGVDNLAAHLEALRDYVAYVVPDPLFDGWIITDIEAYSPFTWQHTGLPQLDAIYKTLSRERVRQRDPSLSDQQVELIAESEFDEAALRLLVESIRAIRALRPRAKQAMYGFPTSRIYDRSWGYLNELYGPQLRETNDRLAPLWNELDGYSPVLYLDVPIGWVYSNGNVQTYEWSTYWIESTFLELARLQPIHGFKPIMPIVWHRFFDGGTPAPYRNQLMPPLDLSIQLQLPQRLGADGVIIWGNEVEPSYGDYVRTVMGPEIRRFCSAAGG